MRRLMFIGLAVVLLAGLASGQVIKYSVSKEADAVFAIGNVVELSASSEVDLCDAGVDAIGFVAMLEAYGTPTVVTYALIVNAGAIDAKATTAIAFGDAITASTVNAGEIEAAGVGDRVIGYALESIAVGATGTIMIQMEPIIDDYGAKKWQMYDGETREYNTVTDIFTADLSSSGGIDVAALDFYFTCTIDDHGSGTVTGTVANFAWVGIDIVASSAPGATVYLLDRHFYQSQTVAMQATWMDPEADDDFTVNVTVTEGLGIDGTGRITKALLTVVGTPRTTGS